MTIDTHLDTQTAPVILNPVDLADLDTHDFYAHVGDVNTAYAAAEAAFRVAQENLLVLLTEQVTRHCLKVAPTAALLFVRVSADFHRDDNGNRSATCEGHNERLIPFEILDEDGNTVATFAPMSPAFFLMERLTPLLGTENQVLYIETRDWALDCTND